MPQSDPLFPTEQAAEYLGGFRPATLAWWRARSRGPVYVKIAGRVFYKKSALDDFVAKGVIDPQATEAA